MIDTELLALIHREFCVCRALGQPRVEVRLHLVDGNDCDILQKRGPEKLTATRSLFLRFSIELPSAATPVARAPLSLTARGLVGVSFALHQPPETASTPMRVNGRLLSLGE